ncbi:MAG: glycosyltransferase family 4 protein [Thermodesulfobacteriota bacterium]
MNNTKLSFHLFAYWHDPLWKHFVGASVKIWDLAWNLAQTGSEVTLFLPKYGFAEKKPPFTVIEIPLLNVPGLRSVSYNLFLLLSLIHRRRTLPDVVYLRRTSLIVPLLYAKMKKARFYLEVNDDPFAGRRGEGGQARSRLRSLLSEFLDRINIRHADRCFVISEAVITKIGKQMPAMPPGKMVVMPSGANTDLMRPADRHASCRTVGLEENLRYVGFVGTLLAHQGVGRLIEAASEIVETVPAARFLIVGDGPMRRVWAEMVEAMGLERYFIFTGEIEYEALPHWINAMDVCVAPYHRDAGLRSPVKMFDYLACGRPVVASDVPGITGIFRNAPLVTLVQPDSPTALAEAVIRILSQPGEPDMDQRMAAHQWIRDRFDRRMMARMVADEAVRQCANQ